MLLYFLQLIYDDRLTISSPGGMPDGSRIQDRDITNISSIRRNPVLADIFARLGYMERQGSGFKKIAEAYHGAYNYNEIMEPKFYSDIISFQVTLYNLNYVAIASDKVAIANDKVAIADDKVAIASDKVAIADDKVAIDKLNASQTTIEKIKLVYEKIGYDSVFGRSDISAITNDSLTAAGNLITKLKKAGLIISVSGFGKGKYKFVKPQK